MANSYAVQILEEGPRNAIVKLTGILDTANEARTIKVDVSAFTIPCSHHKRNHSHCGYRHRPLGFAD